MHRHISSFLRITSRTGFLAIALALGLIFWYLPSLLNLDGLRPPLTELLETTFHCKVNVGEVTGQLIPSPGLVIGHVVLLENSSSPRVLASVNSVHLTLSTRALIKGQLKVTTIRFIRPRFIAHYLQINSGETRWATLALPESGSSSSKGGAGINEWQIRNGSIEIWNEMRTPASKWVMDQLSGTFQVHERTGVLAGKVARLGRHAVLDVHYGGAAAFPLKVHIIHVELSTLQFLTHTRLFTLEGESDLLIKARFKPDLILVAELNQPLGAGLVTASVEAGKHGNWNWSALGKHSALAGTAFQLPEWSAQGDAAGVAVYVRALTAEGGMAEVGWAQPASEKDATLEVNLSSVTIQQVLDIFKVPASHYGYEPWRIRQGSMESVIHHRAQLEVKESDIDLEGLPTGQVGMHLDLTGSFDLARTTTPAHIQGNLQNIPMTHVVESFFTPPSPLTGIGQVNFNLAFPLTSDWTKGLNGPLQVEIHNGVVKALKTIYRISSVLNLGNYLQLRLPRVKAEGIEFTTLMGHLTFQNGMLSTEDLFLKSPNLNVGAVGTLDIPGKRLKTTLRLEMFRFLEDILKAVPITHWIFKKPNKIFLPLVVTLEGPWDAVDIR